MGCEQEQNMLMISIRKMMEAYPELRFTAMANGNHDGGYYMGTISSKKNFWNVVGLVYKDIIFDARVHACLEPEYVQEVHEGREDMDAILRSEDDNYDFFDVVSQIKKGRKNSFKTHEEKIKFEDTDAAYDALWHESESLNRWDAIIYMDKEEYHEHPGQQHVESENEVSHYEGDFKRWIHLQATKSAEFESETSDETYPVYQVTMDTQDHTSFSDSHGSVRGHLSQFQISAVEIYIDKMLAENENAKSTSTSEALLWGMFSLLLAGDQ